jgi:dihydroorotate dehydrogenase
VSPNLDSSLTTQMGGLSGTPLKPLALKTVSSFYKLTGGSVPIIGCGGIKDANDALEFCRAGASLVQVYTSLGYKGPGLVRNIKDDLAKLLRAEGKSWSECIGSDLKKNK